MTISRTDHQEITLNHLVAYHKMFRDNDDNINANKIVDLYQKQKKNEFVISFAGHFSAGKSSMINALLQKDILPKSPIPTSANIIKITSGKGVARVFFHREAPVEYKEPYDIDMIKEYGKDKDTIKRIELSTSENLLPNRCAIVDTPGIDAADDADRLITESSLHLVDALFYVMDYNHVQSEVNLYFLKNIQDMGIPFYIMINQVDKHDEMELSFKEFETRVKNTFQQWNILPKGIYFTSLMDTAHKYNQFESMKEKIFTLFHTGGRTSNRLWGSLKQIIANHKTFLKQRFDELTASFEGGFSSDDKTKLESIKAQIKSIESKSQELEQIFQRDLQTTLNNAYIMPSDLRDKAALFLDSQQSDFKLGLFSTKKKIAKEKEKRMIDFLEPLKKNIEANIQWKLRDKFIKILKENNISDPEIINKTEQLKIEYTSEALLKIIKTGAKVNADYVLNYTKEVSADIKNKFKSQARILLDMMTQSVNEEIQEKVKELEKQRKALEMSSHQQEELNHYQEVLDEQTKRIDNQLHHPDVSELAWKSMQDCIDVRNKPIKQAENPVPNVKEQSKGLSEELKEETITPKRVKERSIEDVSGAVNQAIQTVESLPGFQSIVDDLKDKQHRLDNRTLTIALFGAFSAGKSSFANALLGEGLLPSSPNPTTAVINRIKPVTGEYTHGTVVIHLKDEATLVNDLISLVKQFSPESTTFFELLNWVQRNNLHKNADLNKLYQAYLQAMIEGYEEVKNKIGEKVTISLKDFASFVTNETKACYMESVDLYYDCSLTRQGITLVDTPGADSVNARHTNVAFDYIKYADAILYVTYYNHALSRADKDFLLQLGRVKESFQLDKMFFIINAADLAESDADLKLVMQYVEDQLLQLGIRFPKIFPVSSKQTLENKRNKQVLNSKMDNFEKAFYQFIHNDLAQLSMESALFDIERSYQTLTHYIESANLNEQEKQDYRATLLQKQESLTNTIGDIDASLYNNRIEQRIDKQLHYVDERLSIRFHDMFKEMFNPTTITESGKKAKEQLQRSLVNLIDYTGYELLQELRAVSLRIEAYLFELQKEVYQDTNSKVNQIDSYFMLPALENTDIQTPEYPQAFKDANIEPFNKALSRFKGTKAFFVKNEKEVMKEAIYSILAPWIREYMNTNNDLMKSAYFGQWEKILQSMKKHILASIDNYVEDNLSVMSDTIDLDLLQDKQIKLSIILDKYK